MASAVLIAPKKATRVAYRGNVYAVAQDGTVTVPLFAVPELVAAGCIWLDGDHTSVDERAEVEAAEGHELSHYLNAREVNDHYFEPYTHIFSAVLRESVGHLFVHGEEVKTALTVTEGSNEFSSTAHAVMIGATVKSALLPEGCKVEHIHASTGADSGPGIQGRLKFLAGAGPSDVKTGTDPDAVIVVIVDGHTIADHLDDFHRRFHGPVSAGGHSTGGRIVFYTDDEKRKMALDLHAAENDPA